MAVMASYTAIHKQHWIKVDENEWIIGMFSPMDLVMFACKRCLMLIMDETAVQLKCS